MRNKSMPITVGSIWKSNGYGTFEIVEYINHYNVVIRFTGTGFTTKVQAVQVRHGGIKDPLMPSICGIGFIGGTKYKSRGTSLEVKLYAVWANMIHRCYDPYRLNTYSTYMDCFVCDEWHNFQNFADWFYSKGIGSVEGLFIDKDLKYPGNKIYSPDKCVFVSRDVNNFTTDRGALRGKYLIGVTRKPECKDFTARCHNPETGERDVLGVFDSEIDAHIAWRRAKSNGAKYLASIQDRADVAEAIMSWKKALDDEIIHPYR